jgi:hypothetical protein
MQPKQSFYCFNAIKAAKKCQKQLINNAVSLLTILSTNFFRLLSTLHKAHPLYAQLPKREGCLINPKETDMSKILAALVAGLFAAAAFAQAPAAPAAAPAAKPAAAAPAAAPAAAAPAAAAAKPEMKKEEKPMAKAEKKAAKKKAKKAKMEKKA